MSTKRDCTEKQNLVQPDGTFTWKPAQFTVVDPSPAQPVIVKPAMVTKKATDFRSQDHSSMTSEEGRKIMSVLERIESRIANIENDISHIKRTSNEVGNGGDYLLLGHFGNVKIV